MIADIRGFLRWSGANTKTGPAASLRLHLRTPCKISRHNAGWIQRFISGQVVYIFQYVGKRGVKISGHGIFNAAQIMLRHSVVFLALILTTPLLAQDTLKPVKLLTVQSQDAGSVRQFFGQVVVRQTVDLAFQVGGQIVMFSAIEGQIIPRGRWSPNSIWKASSSRWSRPVCSANRQIGSWSDISGFKAVL